jgi:hypothetical protein
MKQSTKLPKHSQLAFLQAGYDDETGFSLIFSLFLSLEMSWKWHAECLISGET